MDIKNKLNKSDYYDIGLIVLFSLYAYFFMDKMFSVEVIDSATGMKALSLSFMSILITLACFIYSLYKSLNIISGSEYNFGFTIGKSSWIQLGIISVLGIISILNDKTIVITIETFVISISYIFAMIGAELVLKGILIGLIIKLFPVEKIKYSISVLLSGLLFAVIFSNIISFDIYMIMSFIATALIFIGTRNLFFVIFWDSYILFPRDESTNGFALAFVVMVIILYFALAVPAHFIQKRKPKENILTS